MTRDASPIKIFVSSGTPPPYPALLLTKEAIDDDERENGSHPSNVEIRKAWADGKTVWIENRCPLAREK